MPAHPDAAHDLYSLRGGETPLLVNVPHAGTLIPDPALARRLTTQAAALPDTDWHVNRLYDFVGELGCGLMVANFSRYAIDLNRPPDDAALYDSRTTGLVPTETFDGEPIYKPGRTPDAAEIEDRRRQFWDPYHLALRAELDRLHDRHGYAVLLDAHSIRSEVPALFPGRLPIFNLGSNAGRSAADGLLALASGILASDERWDLVVDARFKGGFITRHYGRPEQDIHALQLEMSQRAYMDEATTIASVSSMSPVRGLLRRLITAMSKWHPHH